MTLLEWFPQQPHHLLQVGGRMLAAGDTFEASEEDVEELLGNPEIRVPQRVPAAETGTTGEQEPSNDMSQSQTQSPGRAERSTTTDRRP